MTVTMTDNSGSSNTATLVVTVIDNPPVASFTANATTVETEVGIRFDASGSSDPDGTVAYYLWNFGDGSNASCVTTIHSYATAGSYVVTLIHGINDHRTRRGHYHV